MTAESTFELDRVVTFDVEFIPLLNPTSQPIQAAIAKYDLPPQTKVLVLPLPEKTLVFSTAQMVYHHVAQGRVGDQPWMIAYCLVCNAGSCFSPVIDGVEYKMNVKGLYNAMTLLKDAQTDSYWELITGECLYGPLAGKKFTQLDVSLLHMKLEQAVERYPHAEMVFASLARADEEEAQVDLDAYYPPQRPAGLDHYMKMVNNVDTRLPPTDMGLGVWTKTCARYYAFSSLNASNNALIDHFNDRNLIVYIDPENGVPGAFYTDATSAQWRGDQLALSNRQTLRGGLLHNADGERIPMEQPWQLFHRWFSFAVSFPEGTIYRRS